MRWTFLRAVFHRGYGLTCGLYFVLDAHLSVSQLVGLGTVVSVTLLLSDIPTGAWSDAVSRTRPLVAGHMLLAAGMAMTGLVTAYPLLAVSQALWGVGWGFSSGADVAWITDELGLPGRVARVLAARARWDAIGGATGIAVFGLLGWATGLAATLVTSGAAMGLLGLFVAARFTEDNFAPARERHWSASLSVLQRGLALARRDREIMIVLAATMLINGASMVTWLFPRQLVDLGFSKDPVLWYSALAIGCFAVGAVTLRVVEARVDDARAAPRMYALACLAGILGLVLLAYAPNAFLGAVGVLLMSGISGNVTRAVSVIWVNRRATSEVRATVHSFLSQAECIGEAVSGFALAVLAHAAGIRGTLLTSAALVLAASVTAAQGQADRTRLPAAGLALRRRRPRERAEGARRRLGVRRAGEGSGVCGRGKAPPKGAPEASGK